MPTDVWLKAPTFFVLVSFSVGILNFLDTLIRLMYSFTIHAQYPLDVYLKPIFFLIQAAILIMFIRSIRYVKNPALSGSTLSRFFAMQTVLAVAVVLLYLDFQLASATKMTGVTAFLQLPFLLVYFASLVGTSFWFARELAHQNQSKLWLSVFVLLGCAFVAAAIEPLFFWSQNNVGLAFPSPLVLFGTYAPHVFMFLAAMSTLGILFWHSSTRQPRRFKYVLLLFVPAFFLPLLWNGYKDGLINFVIRDVVYWGLGYYGYEWISVSFYLMAFLAYVLTLRILLSRSERSLAFTLIIFGVASFAWNGVFPFKVGYSFSSVLGNVTSLSSVITGATLINSQKVATV